MACTKISGLIEYIKGKVPIADVFYYAEYRMKGLDGLSSECDNQIYVRPNSNEVLNESYEEDEYGCEYKINSYSLISKFKEVDDIEEAKDKIRSILKGFNKNGCCIDVKGSGWDTETIYENETDTKIKDCDFKLLIIQFDAIQPLGADCCKCPSCLTQLTQN